ncbi:hypothetical protein F3Y22_tig00116959pilonHSYRG00550 [Hibiscus syriacus]|uniref:Uncharacterized protein n=1 Tax=Hibiscus syriacus TaxID=106335 RepID=A0A6A2WX82_HIBSY|nr:hypothetical protein F3Y22_tig00116959pilonHSYRG00550 [Hibiscus syriacus]
MEIHITSKQLVKPSSSKLHLLEPFKFPLLDLLAPRKYTPGVFFYAKLSDSDIDSSQFSEQLKQSLSKALAQFYPASDSTAPQLAVQLNILNCGGIALALCAFHKVFEGTTVGIVNDVRRKITRTYVFDVNAISTLKMKAKSKSLEHPSRVLVLSAFLWKHGIQASRSESGTLKPAILCQPVNIRPRLKPQLPIYSIGNLYSMALMIPSCLLNTLDADADFGWGKPTLISTPAVDNRNRDLHNWFYMKNAKQRNH